MKCIFCQNEMTSLYPAPDGRIPTWRIPTWGCTICPHEVRIQEDSARSGQIGLVCIYVRRGDREYTLSFIYPRYQFYKNIPEKFQIVEVHVDGDLYTNSKLYGSIEIPNITPTNAAEKLAFYLTFS